MDIPAELENISVLFNDRSTKTALHEMATATMPFVVVYCICRLESLHETTQITSRCFQNKMDTIGHQGIQIQTDIIPLYTLSQCLNESFAISICLKKSFPLIATYGYVLDSTFIFDSNRSSHKGNLDKVS